MNRKIRQVTIASAPLPRATNANLAPQPGRLRVALVCDWCLPHFGGLELQLLGAAQALRTAGHTVEIITSSPGPDLLDRIPVHRLGGARLPHFGVTCSPRQFQEFRALLREKSFDVVHVHCSLIAPLAYGCALIAAQYGVPTALTFHSVYDYLRPALHLLARVVGARQLPIAWSAVSGVLASEAAYALDGAPVAVLPNGIDVEAWRCPPRRRVAGEFRLISVMRLHVRKRPMALFDILDAAQRAVGSAVKISLDIVGDGPGRAAVDGRARSLGGGRVRVHGQLTADAIRTLFGQSDAFLLPTRLESFGIAALEARCAGLPVIARRNTGVEDFITAARNGLLGDGDKDLAAAIARLVQDTALHESIVANNHATAPPFGWADVVAAMMVQYDRADHLQATEPARRR